MKLGNTPCVISTAQGMSPAMSVPEQLTLAAFQSHIRAKYLETDKNRGTAGTFMWFIEEVGELATALHKADGQGLQTSGGDNLEEEFADVLAWLCTLANIHGINLSEAIHKKYLSGAGPSGHK